MTRTIASRLDRIERAAPPVQFDPHGQIADSLRVHRKILSAILAAPSCRPDVAADVRGQLDKTEAELSEYAERYPEIVPDVAAPNDPDKCPAMRLLLERLSRIAKNYHEQART